MSVAVVLDRLEGVRECGTGQWRAVCPVHESGGQSRTLAIGEREDGVVVIWCHAGCVTKDVVTAVGLRMSDLFANKQPQSIRHRAGFAKSARGNVETCAAWSNRAERIWNLAGPLGGTLGEIYLRHRGCAFPPEDADLRFLAGTNEHLPSLCARVTDALTGLPISLHFTRLRADGRGKADIVNAKTFLRGHHKRGGVIRLWPDESVTSGLAIAEGIESSLAVAHMFTPVWAAGDAGNLATFPVLSGIDTLTVVADNDLVGVQSADKCAERWLGAGREARVLVPRIANEDAADIAVRMATR